MEWLKKEEWKHAAFSAGMATEGMHPRFGKAAGGRIWIRIHNGLVTGALYISRYGVVLPAFDENKGNREDSRFLEKIHPFRKSSLFSIVGMESRVQFIEQHIRKPSSESIGYRMYIGGTPDFSDYELPPGLSIHRAETTDADKLWKLEKAYQIEEVLRKGHTPDETTGRLHFQHTLKSQLVYYALLDGRPVAKAGTNARGYSYDQIGGVFVIPELRGYGFGRAVMNQLLSAISESGRHSCLFVKETNFPALELYRKLGFIDMDAFRISYWR